MVGFRDVAEAGTEAEVGAAGAAPRRRPGWEKGSDSRPQRLPMFVIYYIGVEYYSLFGRRGVVKFIQVVAVMVLIRRYVTEYRYSSLQGTDT